MTNKLDQIRSALPVTEKFAYLNVGTAGPLPRSAAQAIAAEADRQLREGRSNFKVYLNEYFPLIDDLRSRFARLLNARPDEIAVTHHTTEGMNIAVWGIGWKTGDEIVTTSGEHEGGLLPVYAATRRFGLSLKVADWHAGDNVEQVADRITALISPRTRLVVVSHVNFKTGDVLPLRDICEAAHRHGALVAVDGAQSAGAIPVNVRDLGVDFYAVPGQKWLCGPEGVGALFVNGDRLSELSPTFVGFLSLRTFVDMDHSGYFIPAPGAKRFEVGTIYYPALYGMRESLRWLEEEVGWEWLFTVIRQMTAYCRERIEELPGAVLHTSSNYAGLSTFAVSGIDPVIAHPALYDANVVVRSISEPLSLRATTSFYNSRADVDRLCDELLKLRKA